MHVKSLPRELIRAVLLTLVTLSLMVMIAAPSFAQVTTTVQVSVVNQQGVLTSDDEALLRDETAKIAFPSEVERVVYMAFATNSSNINDDVVKWAMKNDPTMLSTDGNKFAPGVIISVVGLDPRQAGMYCGDNVCQALDIFQGPHLDAAIEAMKPGFRRGNFATGLIDGMQTASDPTIRAQAPSQSSSDNNTLPVSSGTFLGGIVAFIAAVWAIMIGAIFGSRVKAARTAYHNLKDSMGNVALELDEVNVRANSLSSPLANAKMRSEWEEVLNNFLAIRDTANLVETWDREPSRMQLWRHASALQKADERVTQMKTAQANINDLFEMEQGNPEVRQQKLVELGWDLTEAISASSSDLSRQDLTNVKQQVAALEAKINDPDFMTGYARVIGEYQNVLEGIATREYGERALAQASQDAPTIYDSDWRVGMGYNNWVPYTVFHTNYISYSSTTSDDTWSSSWGSSSGSFGGGNTSFSGGFSGGGGSSSW